ncbi:MAG TPA: DUF4365 domain-containing protein [Abditibacteriaceae bacterium]|jgi:hypothetical protein
MNPLRDTDVEEQLSIAYLHAVCAHARMCKGSTGRLEDNAGIDATVTVWLPENGDDWEEFDIKFQLKATKLPPVETETHYSYSLKKAHYDQLRKPRLVSQRILVVLFLPPNFDQWLTHSHEQLLLRRSAYWVSLNGAAPSTNDTSQTVYLPKNQPFSPQSLRDLAARISRKDAPVYDLP